MKKKLKKGKAAVMDEVKGEMIKNRVWLVNRFCLDIVLYGFGNKV